MRDLKTHPALCLAKRQEHIRGVTVSRNHVIGLQVDFYLTNLLTQGRGTMPP